MLASGHVTNAAQRSRARERDAVPGPDPRDGSAHPGRRRLKLDRRPPQRRNALGERLVSTHQGRDPGGPRVERLYARRPRDGAARESAAPLDAGLAPRTALLASRQRVSGRRAMAGRCLGVRGPSGERGPLAERALALVVIAGVKLAGAAVRLRGSVQRENARCAGQRRRDEECRDASEAGLARPPEHFNRV